MLMIMRQELFGQDVYTRSQMDCFHHLCAKKRLSERHVVVCVHLPRAIPLSRVTLENLCTQERGLARPVEALEFIAIVGFHRPHHGNAEFRGPEMSGPRFTCSMT